MKRCKKILFFTSLAFLLVAGSLCAASPTHYALRSFLETSHDVVTLKDLLLNKNAFKSFSTDTLDSPVLLVEKGGENRFSSREIHKRFASLLPPQTLSLIQIPRGGIRVRRVYRINHAHILQIFKKTLQSHFATMGSIHVKTFKVTGNTLLPSQRYHIEVFPPPRFQPTMRMKIKIKGKRWTRTLHAWGKVAIVSKVLVAKKTIERGEKLSPANTALIEKDTTRLHLPYLSSFTSCTGKVAKRTIPAGRLITREMITNPILVKRGEVVTVKVQTPNILITTLAIARQEGRYGDIIRVQNIQSKKTIYAKVASKHLVTVEF